MKIHKIIVSAVLAICLFGSIAVSAAPDTLSVGATGNASDLIVITNPPKDKAATFDRSYIISGYGKEGVNCTLYMLSSGAYKKTGYNWKIGASGIFFKRIELGRGVNNIMCYGEKDGLNQRVPLEITYLGTGFSEMINGIKVDANSVLGK